MSKNKVQERCQRKEIAKFYYTAQKMFAELKVSRGILYIVAIIPVVLAFIPATATAAFILSIISFLLSLLNEALSSFTSEYKKKAIMEYQLYETGITGSDFAKIEYDRETTNELNELAIRKGLPQMRDREKLYEPFVPADISDDYSYMYLCRKSAATTKYLLSRIFYIYFVFLIMLAVGFVFAIFAMSEPIEYMTLLITSYPLVSPIIKACGKCKECMKECTKMCADIDNFFADGDVSYERLARMYYYVQTLEFEMITVRPAIYGLYSRLFRNGTKDLEEGVTSRFMSAIVELKGKSMVQKGIISAPKGRELITRDGYDMTTLEKIEKSKRQKSKTAKTHINEQSTATQNTGKEQLDGAEKVTAKEQSNDAHKQSEKKSPAKQTQPKNKL